MRQKSLSIQAEDGKSSGILEWFCIYIAKSSLNMRQKYFSVQGEYVYGEYARSILPYLENTPIDIKSSLSRRTSVYNQHKFRS